MKTPSKSVWTKTNVSRLYLHLNRRYYVRLFIGGKEIWKSLQTKLKSDTIERFQEHVANAQQQRAIDRELEVRDVVELYRQNFLRDVEIADGAKNFREAGIKRGFKTWPGQGS